MNKQSEYSSIIKDAWLNISVDESELINPFSLQTEHDFPVKLTWILSNPEYCFTPARTFNRAGYVYPIHARFCLDLPQLNTCDWCDYVPSGQ